MFPSAEKIIFYGEETIRRFFQKKILFGRAQLNRGTKIKNTVFRFKIPIIMLFFIVLFGIIDGNFVDSAVFVVISALVLKISFDISVMFFEETKALGCGMVIAAAAVIILLMFPKIRGFADIIAAVLSGCILAVIAMFIVLMNKKGIMYILFRIIKKKSK